MGENSEKNEKNEIKEQIIVENIENEMKKSYLDYGMSVIIGRALPDVKDGLKPVHRRILYSMYESGITPKEPYKKCARIVGDTLGKYHPHGDMAVYDSLVRMAQDFSYRYPLIDGQGNFGSIDGDSPAAMRYTEARLADISMEILQDIDKETVDFVPNFDNSLKEPVVLPGKFPNLLVNGSSGIAVGMATNMPSHNLKEVVDAIIAQIDNPEITLKELMKFIPGPDFPTGGEIYGTQGIIQAYETGRGIIKLRAKLEVEERKNSKNIIIKEIPYLVNKATLVENIANLIQSKKIYGIKDIRDESDRKGMRIVIELKHGVQEEILINQLFKYTQLETTYGIINLALVNGVPKILGLKDLISEYIKYRENIIKKREEFELKKAEERKHILEGFKVVISNIDTIVKGIKESGSMQEAMDFLMKNFNLSETQSKSILNMRLQQLTKLEQGKIENEYKSLVEQISKHKETLSDVKKIYEIMKNELRELKEKYGDERRTKIYSEVYEYNEEDLIPNEKTIIMLTNDGYIKRMSENTFKLQKRSGIGVKNIEEGFIRDIVIANMHDNGLLFTNKGRVYSIKIYEIPEGTKTSKGKAGINIVKLTENEKIISILPCESFNKDKFLLMATEKGIIKKTSLSEYKDIISRGIIAMNLKENDNLIEARIINPEDDVILATKNGKIIRFSADEVRTVGRKSIGVKGISLDQGDKVVGMVTASKNEINNYILTISEKGYGKITLINKYRKQKKGGKGVLNLKISNKNGNVVAIKKVNKENEILLASNAKQVGNIIKIKVSEIRETGRVAVGVRLMKFRNDDERICAVEIV